jgi:NAD(P)-dependent dehydrogenase (short-subunit alcohol dehydrogenase family)
MTAELDGRVAVVTGGASGLGRATVELFVAEGALVVIADVDTDQGTALAKELGDSAVFAPTDVSDADQVQAMVDLAVTRFGGLDILFNNAGIGSPMTGFLQDDLSGFTREMNVNVFGVMVGTQRAARYMKDHGGGSVINNSSLAGLVAGPGLVTYRTAKAAVIHFTKVAAVDLGPFGIRVNCVAPAHIETNITTYDVNPIIKYTQPLPRQGTPDDVAQAVLYLASDRAAQVSGAILPVDGATAAGAPFSQAKLIMGAGKDPGA